MEPELKELMAVVEMLANTWRQDRDGNREAVEREAAAFAVRLLERVPCSHAPMFRGDTKDCLERIADGEEIAYLTMRPDVALDDGTEIAAATKRPLTRRPWEDKDRCGRCVEIDRWRKVLEAK